MGRDARRVQPDEPVLTDDLASRGITVNCVNPGPTDTGWGLADVDPSPRMPAGRWGEPDDAARLIAWLCSDDARWVTGHALMVDGGMTIGMWRS